MQSRVNICFCNEHAVHEHILFLSCSLRKSRWDNGILKTKIILFEIELDAKRIFLRATQHRKHRNTCRATCFMHRVDVYTATLTLAVAKHWEPCARYPDYRCAFADKEKFFFCLEILSQFGKEPSRTENSWSTYTRSRLLAHSCNNVKDFSRPSNRLLVYVGFPIRS